MNFEEPFSVYGDSNAPYARRCITPNAQFYITEWNGDWGISIHSLAPNNKSYEDMVAMAESFQEWLVANNVTLIANLDVDAKEEFE